jgi:hypothetical protein
MRTSADPAIPKILLAFKAKEKAPFRKLLLYPLFRESTIFTRRLH